MTESDIKKLINSEISKFVSDSFDKEMRKILHKSGSASRDELVEMFRNNLEQVFKVMWTKNFWRSDIK